MRRLHLLDHGIRKLRGTRGTANVARQRLALDVDGLQRLLHLLIVWESRDGGLWLGIATHCETRKGQQDDELAAIHARYLNFRGRKFSEFPAALTADFPVEFVPSFYFNELDEMVRQYS